MSFDFIKQDIEDVIKITSKTFEDNRGYFIESYKKSVFMANGIKDDFKQDNRSYSKRGVLRGLHYQTKPYEQSKLVSCIKGCIIDVAVDIRPKSKTFGKYIKVELNDENKSMLYIPHGFAHGFVVLSEEAIVTYKTSSEYSPENERGIFWADSTLNVNWGINFTPIVSDKDLKLPLFKNINMEELQ